MMSGIVYGKQKLEAIFNFDKEKGVDSQLSLELDVCNSAVFSRVNLIHFAK